MAINILEIDFETHFKKVEELEKKVETLKERLEALIKWQGKVPTKSYMEY